MPTPRIHSTAHSFTEDDLVTETMVEVGNVLLCPKGPSSPRESSDDLGVLGNAAMRAPLIGFNPRLLANYGVITSFKGFIQL